jgi:hypothetical protein
MPLGLKRSCSGGILSAWSFPRGFIDKDAVEAVQRGRIEI